ncbi:MAG: hypothetical protein WC497_06115 [Patescibacteria group bacterium]
MTHQHQFLQPELKLLPAPKQSEAEAIVAGKPLSDYLRLIMKPVLVALALLMASEFTDVFPYFNLLIMTGLFVYLGLAARSRTFHTEASIIAGGFAGGVLGLVYAFFRFIVHLKFPMFFQMITDPVMLAVLGMILTGLVNWLVTESLVSLRQVFIKK